MSALKNHFATIQWGTLPSECMKDEPSVKLESLTIKPSRDKKAYKGSCGETFALRFTNPTVEFALSGIITSMAGLADQHPGTRVLSLDNFTTAIHGYDPGIGIMVYEDPERTYSPENPAMMKCNVIHYPHVSTDYHEF